jgi:predicted RNA-binding Zn-ribbon protein involved in translation (DUF1610 family)
MSRIHTESFPCPKCGQTIEFGVIASVNADRRPDLRQAILDNTFQVGKCPQCGESFRLEPDLTYLDAARKQWILVLPADQFASWPSLEQNARSAFDRTYGAEAGEVAQELGRSLQARIAFGWPALREKVMCVEHGLDDATLELLKMAIIRSMDDSPLEDTTELRLIEVAGDELVLYWLKATVEQAVESLRAPRALYDSILADPANWQDLRAEVTAGPFVDVTRLLVPAATAESEGEE